MFCDNYDSLLKALRDRGFTPHTAASGEETARLALSLIGQGSVGCGGSMTVKGLGLHDTLRTQGAQVYFHWDVEPARRPEVFARAASADWYLASANAITRDGVLINIDGTGNRVAGMFFGPRKVLLIVGKNKLAADTASAIERIKSVACPLNARRIGLSTPCALTGKCGNCRSPERICNVTSIIEFKPATVREFHLILVDQELGY